MKKQVFFPPSGIFGPRDKEEGGERRMEKKAEIKESAIRLRYPILVKEAQRGHSIEKRGAATTHQKHRHRRTRARAGAGARTASPTPPRAPLC